MKRVLLGLVMIVAGALMANAFNVIVRSEDGSTRSYSSETIRKIEMATTGVVTLYFQSGNITTVDAADFAGLQIEDNTGINLTAAESAFTLTPDGFLLPRDNEGNVEIFTLSGQRVAARAAKGGIDISNLPSGAYIIKTKNHASKIYLK